MISGLERRRIADTATLLRTRRISATELVREAIARAENRRDLNAFTLLMADQALADAAEVDREIAAGRYRGPLHGIPITVKDLVDVRGTPTTAASRVPAPIAPADAPVVSRLREAGAIIIGKTNLHEFAFGTTSDETAFGAVANPVDRTRSAGGSSGGSAAAVAHRHWIRLGRHRYRRLDSHPRRRMRHRRPEADARRAAVRRRHPPEHDPRPRRAAGAIGGRRQPAVPGDEVLERSRHRAGWRRR